MAEEAVESWNTAGSGVFLAVLGSAEADLLAACILCIFIWEAVWDNMTWFLAPCGFHRLCISDWHNELTFAVVQVNMHRLALTEGTESHHVLVGVEWDAVKRGAVTKLGVHCHLITWEDKKKQLTAAAMMHDPLRRASLFLEHPHQFQCSTRKPFHPRCLKRWSFHTVWRCCRSSLCSLWLQCTS